MATARIAPVPSPRVRSAGRPAEVYELVRTAQRAALDAVEAGAEGRAVDAVAREIIDAAGHGERFGHGLGHGVGMEVHEAPRLSTRSDDVIEAGEVVTIEPGVYLPGELGVRIEDLVTVTADGCRNLSGPPQGAADRRLSAVSSGLAAQVDVGGRGGRRRPRPARPPPRGPRGRPARQGSACSAGGSTRSGGDPGAGDLDRVGVGVGAAAAGLDRVLDPASSAAETSSSKTLGERVEPRPITGPEPSGCRPVSFSSIPGASVAWVTSTATATSGRNGEGRGAGAEKPDLLLDRGDRRE